MSNLSEQDIKTHIQNIRNILNSNPTAPKSLETELESAAKHIPAYTKIVKTHIEQLRKVLELENHNHRTIESAGLATSVQQLIKLFNTLQDDDIQLIEDLALAAANWQADSDSEVTDRTSRQFESAETTS